VTVSIRARAASAVRHVELLLFPSFCRLCSRPLGRPGEKIVCQDCFGRLEARRGPVCLCCGRFFEGAGEDHICRRCLDRPPSFSVHRSCGRYEGVLKDLILLFKYRKFSVLGRGLASYAVESLGADEALWQDADFLVPVPLHAARKRERGFNQSHVLARELARIKGMRLLSGCLVKIKNVAPQTSLEGAGREDNVRGAYAARRPSKIEGKIVVLVDDVFTTGSTLRECGLVLRAAGARDVRGLTLAQA
jgi:ComF family protein